jgi:molybdopterin synthase sulfur carrier subunit
MTSVRVPAMLRPTVGGERSVVAQGATLREVINDVEGKHPGFAGQLLEPDGRQRSFVNIYLNDDDVRYLKGLDTVVEEGDVVSILPAVAGGAD